MSIYNRSPFDASSGGGIPSGLTAGILVSDSSGTVTSTMAPTITGVMTSGGSRITSMTSGVVISSSSGSLSSTQVLSVNSVAVTSLTSGVVMSSSAGALSSTQSPTITGTLSAGSISCSSLAMTTSPVAGAVLTSDASGNASWSTTTSLATKYQRRLLMSDSMNQAAINTNIWATTTDNIVSGTAPNTSTQAIAEGSGYVQISGTTGVSFWSGKGLITTKSFTYGLDYDIQVDMYRDNNAASDSVASLELYQTSSVNNYGIYLSNSGGVQRYSNVTGTQYVQNLDCISIPAATNATWFTASLQKRGNTVTLYWGAAGSTLTPITTFTYTITGDFNIRLMGYARASADAPILRFRNFYTYMYPQSMYTLTIPSIPLLQAAGGAGWDSKQVKDPEVVLGGSGVYYIFYSGYNGTTFRSGYASLGTNLAAPTVGARAQLTLSAGTDNGAPSVYYDSGTGIYWLFLQTSAGPGASIQVYFSAPGIPGSYTLSGTAIAGGAAAWSNGVYDPCIVKEGKIGGQYYMYFTATAATFNTAGYTRTYGLAVASNISGPWAVVGQVKLHSELDNITFGMEAPNVFYNASTGTFHLMATGGHLGAQEILLNFMSYDGLNFFACNNVGVIGGLNQLWNFYAAGSGSWLVSGSNIYAYYQGQNSTGGTYSIGYVSFTASEFITRCMALPSPAIPVSPSVTPFLLTSAVTTTSPPLLGTKGKKLPLPLPGDGEFELL